ncbi:class D beta-lactamase [Aggregicoccus sp. 17bor-14]|uniref:penicillin-binding transpeptidase domain-containing protein n=1 Tax=Myxococcaceae TaxID=31 RepID=UPI00129CB11A|nr:MULTISPECIES: penicillin-binding transpeptidase domain-containing protein [Myxococcaceae]MBF5046040.1 class D beta-lactamase [Simulacricoccus sp. 17bor-14]MRI91770.1 class D beta-lactamase [Aggregicoccus sp. 17bor-14]
MTPCPLPSVRLLFPLLLAAGLAHAAPPAPSTASDIPGNPRVEVDAGGAALFRDAGVQGAFVLLDVQRNVLTVVNPGEAARAHLPCSTFKIPNTLVGLETGVIPGLDFALKWDGTKRSVPQWNRDHTLPTAMRDSVVWFYQEVARRVGLERMREKVQALGYGNAQVGEHVDTFWLEGPLLITPREQVAFLRRLQAGTLPVKPANAALVRQLIVLEQRPGFSLRGKTGLGREQGRAVGWLVGEVEQDGAQYVFATLTLDAKGNTDRLAPLRRPLTEKLLARYGALKR